MSSQETPDTRDMNNPATLERARKRIAAVVNAGNEEAMHNAAVLAEGWIGALHVESLLDKEQYEVLDSELDYAVANWRKSPT